MGEMSRSAWIINVAINNKETNLGLRYLISLGGRMKIK